MGENLLAISGRVYLYGCYRQGADSGGSEWLSIMEPQPTTPMCCRMLKEQRRARPIPATYPNLVLDYLFDPGRESCLPVSVSMRKNGYFRTKV